MTQEQRTDQLFEEHCDFIYANFGEKVNANFGWVQDDNEFSSKIYSTPHKYVTSVRHGDTITHNIE